MIRFSLRLIVVGLFAAFIVTAVGGSRAISQSGAAFSRSDGFFVPSEKVHWVKSVAHRSLYTTVLASMFDCQILIKNTSDAELGVIVYPPGPVPAETPPTGIVAAHSTGTFTATEKRSISAKSLAGKDPEEQTFEYGMIWLLP